MKCLRIQPHPRHDGVVLWLLQPPEEDGYTHNPDYWVLLAVARHLLGGGGRRFYMWVSVLVGSVVQRQLGFEVLSRKRSQDVNISSRILGLLVSFCGYTSHKFNSLTAGEMELSELHKFFFLCSVPRE